MVVAAFSLADKANWVRFFKKTFLKANISPKISLEMLFITLNGADIDFFDRELQWRTYTIKEALPTAKHVKLVKKKEFVTVAHNLEYKTFIVYVVSLSSISLIALLGSTPFNVDVHLSYRRQISGLIVEKAPTKILDTYVDFADIFFLDLVSKLSKHTGINDYTIKLVDN